MDKLYETGSMVRELKATVTDLIKDDTSVKITLDRSIFFPEGGGQYADRGMLIILDNSDDMSNAGPSGNATEVHALGGQENITKVHILDGQENITEVHILDGQEIKTEDGRKVVYTVDREIAPGTEVLCKLDWNLRFSRMQQHSGEHVLTGIIHNTFGYNNTSFHLSDDEPVIVCFSGPLTDEQIEAVEIEANKVIYENLPIRDTYPSKEELAGINYRSKIEIEGQVRIVTVGNAPADAENINYRTVDGDGDTVDICACCAPHVPSTAYIGIIKVISSQSYKGGTQLNILCGSRAFRYLQDEHKMVTRLSHEFSTSQDSLPVILLSQRDRLNEAENEIGRIREEGYLAAIAKMKDRDVPVFFADDMSAHAMKICYNALCNKFSGFCGVFSGSDESGYRFYAGNPKLDSNELAKLMRERLDAKGGGSREMIQGKLQSKAADIVDLFSWR